MSPSMTSLEPGLIEMRPHGHILVLSAPKETLGIKPNSLIELLMRFVDEEKPYVGMIIDIGETEYSPSEADMDVLAKALEDTVRNRTTPCVIIARSIGIRRFRAALDFSPLRFKEEISFAEDHDSAVRFLNKVLTGFKEKAKEEKRKKDAELYGDEFLED